jgi:citrate synthase
MAATDLLGADAAAQLLGVTRRTLYAYVSRGLISSQPGPGPSRARRYPRAALEELLRARSASPAERAAGTAMQWGPAVLESELTLIADGQLSYRGHDAIRLSRDASLEQVAHLLWTGTQTTTEDWFSSPAPRRVGTDASPPLLASMEAALLQATRRRLASVSSPGPARLRAASEVVTLLFASAGAVGAGPLAGRLARGWRTEHEQTIGAALVLCADHELNVSAFTARCVASADARLEHVVMAALCAFQGRRHGGAGARVQAMLDDTLRDGVDRALERALSEQGKVPGFGHPLYPDGDPRATELLRLIPPSPGRSNVVSELERTCREQLDLKPNLDFGLAAVSHGLKLPPGAGTAIFALGRSVGWIAHAFETWDSGMFIRPRARYTGPSPDR